MKTLLLLCVSALVLLATGCGTPKVWYQADKTPAQAYKDLIHCREQAQSSMDPHGVSGFMPLLMRPNTGDFVNDCMRAEGWQLTPRNQVPNGEAYPKED